MVFEILLRPSKYMKFVLAKIGVYIPKLAHIKGNTFVNGGSDF